MKERKQTKKKKSGKGRKKIIRAMREKNILTVVQNEILHNIYGIFASYHS